MFRKLLGERFNKIRTYFVVNVDWILRSIEFLMKTTKISIKHTSSIRKADSMVQQIEQVMREILKMELYPKLVVAFMVSISAPVMVVWKLAVDMTADFFHFAGTCLMPIRTGLLFFPLSLLSPAFQKSPAPVVPNLAQHELQSQTKPQPQSSPQPQTQPQAILEEEGNNATGAARAQSGQVSRFEHEEEKTPLQIALKTQAIEQIAMNATHHSTSKLLKHGSHMQRPVKQEPKFILNLKT